MQVKPLGQLVKHPSGTSSATPGSGKSFVESPQPVTRSTTAPHSRDNYEHHSSHSSRRSKHYKEVVVGTADTAQYGDRAIATLNPSKSRPSTRSFPGLAN